MNSYIFVNGVGINKIKANDSEINAASLCLGIGSKDCSVDKMKKVDYMIFQSIMIVLKLLIF